MSQTKVLIGIQARLTNTRLPEKCRELISGVPILERVISACKKSQSYINQSGKDDIKVEVCLLTPTGDPLAQEYKSHCPVVEGPEEDVLSRYNIAMEQFDPDFLVRITSDCPLIPPFIISKHILAAVKYRYDYVSNVHPDIRTHPDGWDTEVVSQRLMKWLHQNAVEKEDREHVTPLLRQDPPGWATIANAVSYMDNSHLKLSVDTKEDLHFVRTYHDILSRKLEAAKESGHWMFRI